MSVTIYHNPRCSKSRQAKALLDEKAVDFTVIEYLKDTPSQAFFVKALHTLGHDILRMKEADYKENFSQDTSIEEIAKKLTQFPKAMERPLVVNGDKMAIGRPTENILEIL